MSYTEYYIRKSKQDWWIQNARSAVKNVVIFLGITAHLSVLMRLCKNNMHPLHNRVFCQRVDSNFAKLLFYWTYWVTRNIWMYISLTASFECQITSKTFPNYLFHCRYTTLKIILKIMSSLNTLFLICYLLVVRLAYQLLQDLRESFYGGN